ncbi:unnamed protein product [Diatraea saccharalis]|uniref:Uncharacterized protein n=1 Tax=Diatraea saccharalis TaxID=40085 RepID=A0A9N9R907_9NEOP|nr:unnamed protein product [Diatraea saccharalis]
MKMPNTRKKVIKVVYKAEDDSDIGEAFSDSGSEAQISEESSSEDGCEEQEVSSGEEFKNIKKSIATKTVRKLKFAKSFINKINKQTSADSENENVDSEPPLFSVKDLTEEDKLLPSILNLSESDTSDDECQKPALKQNVNTSTLPQNQNSDSDDDNKIEYQDVWSKNLQDNSEEIAKKAFLELEHHKSLMEETKASLDKYKHKDEKGIEFEVNDLLAQGEEITPIPKTTPIKKPTRSQKVKDASDSETEDWEEVKESKTIPKQGLQLIVELPNTICKKTKKIDVEMMMKRKMNRVKKEYQVFMHKVHVLCWLGHGNFVSKILNDQELLAASLSLVPSKECYPSERVDMKYLEQITTWYKDKFTLKQDKNEHKYKPKAPPLKELLITQIKSRVVTTKKYLVYIFVCMLRALGLQCRVMFNFVTLPLKPPSSELCSLSTKPKNDKNNVEEKATTKQASKIPSNIKKKNSKKPQSKEKIHQIDGADDDCYVSCDSYENIVQLDGNNDRPLLETRNTRSRKPKATSSSAMVTEDDVSPPKRSRKNKSPNVKAKDIANTSNTMQNIDDKNNDASTCISKVKRVQKSPAKSVIKNDAVTDDTIKKNNSTKYIASPHKTRNTKSNLSLSNDKDTVEKNLTRKSKTKPPLIILTSENDNMSSKYFDIKEEENKINLRLSRKRSKTATTDNSLLAIEKKEMDCKPVKTRTKSVPGTNDEKSKYFETSPSQVKKPKLSMSKVKPLKDKDDQKRVSHRDLTKPKINKNDVKEDLVTLIKGRIKEAKEDSKKGIVKGKVKINSEEDSDYLPEEDSKSKAANSDDDFKPTKVTPKPSTSKKIDRRVLSSSEEDLPKNKIDVWCEVFVEELEQWICVDVVKAKVHCAESIYSGATHPVCYVVGWDNNNYLKDLTRRYVPHWNTITRKQRAEPKWWNEAIQPWLGPKTACDKEEDEQLDRMQLEAPLPKSIAEYKNHPLYALKRHLLKYEALYPPDAAVLGFVRQEPVYARECVYVCRSRETWLKEAKVVRLGEQPYKVVKARPKWDKLSNKLITDKPLEIFGPWQVQDYEPPTAENGIVPRNAYGNVELFKDCMLPKGTVHIKLPGLNKVAKKLNIDCAPAMTGFDFNGGWSHPVFDGFVVCAEYKDTITDAWVQDQEEQERKEREKIDARVYGNWRRLIKGLLIRERLKDKYGFEEPSKNKKNPKGPRLVVKKK